MIEYDFVPLHKMVHEIAPHVERFYADAKDENDQRVPLVDWGLYMEASFTGQCVVVTARDGGKLVGYNAFIIGNNPRHSDTVMATSQSLYVEKEYRSRGVGNALIEKADEYLHKLGVKETKYINDKKSFGRWMMKKGYRPEATVWSKSHG